MTNLAKRTESPISRPLKVLIPLIQSELQKGKAAGQDYYRIAGDMLIEAKSQLAYGAWVRWLTKNFDLSQRTASDYMRWAREHQQIGSGAADSPYRSLREMSGHTARDRESRQSKQQQDFQRVLRDVARDDFVQERQNRDDETRLHRDLADELIDIGYRALATRLHPDRGGSKDAMTRLNRVRDELKQVSQTRRYI